MKKIVSKSLISIGLCLGANASDYTMTPDGNYVGGSTYSMTPDGSYVGGSTYNMAPMVRIIVVALQQLHLMVDM